MAVFKCKMCGGSLEITEGMTVCECEYCGTIQTLPKTDNEQNLNMINRANHFRQQCEFDKAMEIYERILKNSEDAEIYWSIVLCRYGIEYVDDPLTKKKIPTCHRTQYKSILNDVDYLEALSHADAMQREVFESEAKYIDTVQKGILEISNKEEPFDVFICYKETDANGRRTQDSVLAQDLYYQLTREGFKVFFSRITLEDKLGTEYEPYIFAALNSSKVMVVVGTKPEYFDAVWVKNEWSRYLMMMQEDHSKTIIPAYRDMDPYDLPDALSMYQAQDMSKLGFMQDLIRGIGKIAKTEPKQTIIKEVVCDTKTADSNGEYLLKRGNVSLIYKDWKKARECFEEVLNQNAEEAKAYLGLLMVDLEVQTEEILVTERNNFGDNVNYKKALRFGDNSFKDKMKQLLLEADYNFSVATMKSAKTGNDFYDAEKLFESLGNYRDSVNNARLCKVKIAKCKEFEDKKAVYEDASMKHNSNRVEELEEAISLYETIEDFKDSKFLIEECKQKIDRINKENEETKKAKTRKKKKIKITTVILSIAVILGTVGTIVTNKVIIPEIKYSNAVEQLQIGNYKDARSIFSNLNGYKDSKDYIVECDYEEAVSLMSRKRYKDAITLFSTLNGYERSNEYITECMYQEAISLMNKKQNEEAIASFEVLNGYKKSSEYITKCMYQEAIELKNKKQYEEAIALFESLDGYYDSEDKIIVTKYEQAKHLYEESNYSKAYDILKLIITEDNIDNIEYLYDNCLTYISCIESFFDTELGDTIDFGGYSWIVLNKSDRVWTVICEDAVCYNTQYNIINEDVTWKSCSLRSWLNNEFYNSFSESERKMISKKRVINPNNSEYGTYGGNDTEDYIYLQSYDEYKQYKDFLSYTVYSKQSWLRTPGEKQNSAITISSSGSIIKNVDGFADVYPVLNLEF